MSESPDGEELDLAVLAKRLVVEGMPVQAVIASEAGVSQPTVSRAVRGQIKRPSKGARKLWEYAVGRIAILHEQQSNGGVRAAHRSQGVKDNADPGSAALGPRTANVEPRKRARPIPRRKSESDGTQLSDQERQELAEAAIAGLRDYLDDAFDPQLVIEQLAVLRRAQDSARRHRSRSAGASSE